MHFQTGSVQETVCLSTTSHQHSFAYCSSHWTCPDGYVRTYIRTYVRWLLRAEGEIACVYVNGMNKRILCSCSWKAQVLIPTNSGSTLQDPTSGCFMLRGLLTKFAEK